MSSDEFVTRTLCCPLCDTLFTCDQPVVPMSTGRDSDLRPLFDGRDPLPSLVLCCPRCRYAAYAEGFIEQERPDEEQIGFSIDVGDRPAPRSLVPLDDEADNLRRYVASSEYVEGISTGPEPFGPVRFFLAARCHEFRYDDLEGAADFYLRGSWCARSLGLRDWECSCQREAATRLETALTKNLIKEPDRPRAVFLAAELRRRAGDFSQAVDGFERLKSLCDEDDEEGGQLAEVGRKLYALASVMSSVNAEWPRPPPTAPEEE
jgi:hypothetical protein